MGKRNDFKTGGLIFQEIYTPLSRYKLCFYSVYIKEKIWFKYKNVWLWMCNVVHMIQFELTLQLFYESEK